MVETHRWFLPTNDGIPRLQKPPLLYWLIIGSFKLFGVNTAGAGPPRALAGGACVSVIFFFFFFVGGRESEDLWGGFSWSFLLSMLLGSFFFGALCHA